LAFDLVVLFSVLRVVFLARANRFTGGAKALGPQESFLDPPALLAGIRGADAGARASARVQLGRARLWRRLGSLAGPGTPRRPPRDRLVAATK
jgi:hypothetical protein